MAEVSTERYLVARPLGTVSFSEESLLPDGWIEGSSALSPLVSESRLIRVKFSNNDDSRFLDGILLTLEFETTQGIVQLEPVRLWRQVNPITVDFSVSGFVGAAKVLGSRVRVKFLWAFGVIARRDIGNWSVEIEELLKTDSAVPFTPDWFQDIGGRIGRFLVDSAGRVVLRRLAGG